MRKIQGRTDENCIPTPSTCVEWQGGTIEFLGICDGDNLNKLMWEVVTKLEEIAGEDLSQFDIDSLLDICNQKAPLEITLLSILTLIKDNQVCLKDFIDELNERLNEIFANTGVNVNLKCYAEFDNQGNPLSMTRDALDQLVINILCDHKFRIETLEGKIITLQQQVDDIDPHATVDELSFDTCIEPGVVKTTSANVIDLADAHCDLEGATGSPADISTALGNTPSYPVEVTTHPNYIASPANWAENYSNLLLFNQYLLGVIEDVIECCAANCDDIKLGFSAVYDEDGSDVLIEFTWGAGTIIPAGFTDCGSTGVITDVDGNTSSFNIDILDGQASVSVVGLNTLSPLEVNITVKLCSGTVTCQKCVTRSVTSTACAYCTLTATGSTGSVVITYSTPDVALD